jgi:predicted nuclease of predicted toxin-antitoxin system
VRFKADENLPQSVTNLLKNAGHDVQTVLDEALGGRDDGHVLAVAARESRAFITLDKDFADIRTYAPTQHSGIMVLRPRDQRVATIAAAIARLMPLIDVENIAGSLWIVDERRVRVRR